MNETQQVREILLKREDRVRELEKQVRSYDFVLKVLLNKLKAPEAHVPAIIDELEATIRQLSKEYGL